MFKRISLVLWSLLFLWLAGFAAFVLILPPQSKTSEEITDAIVVLTGGSGRIVEGLRLLEARFAEKMFISGVHDDVVLPEILRKKSSLDCCVELGYEATNTIQNADEVSAWVARNNIHSLRLVTSVYHIPRSMILHRRALPDEVRIVPHPVYRDEVDYIHWYKHFLGWRRMLIEYHKYLYTLVT